MHCVDFMKIWITYDKDRSGDIEEHELEAFLVDYLKGRGQDHTDKETIAKLSESIMKAVDIDSDKNISLAELARFLRVEDNFLSKFGRRVTRTEFLEVFDHYDKNKDGKIDGAELMALMRDILMKEGENPTAKELELYKEHILKIYDVSCDKALGKEELSLLIPIKK